MSYDLYLTRPSAPCRAVLMLARELGVELNVKILDLMAKEHLTPEYLALNPHHTVPTLVDKDAGDFVLWESRAILRYLVDKVSPGHALYSSDLKVRAKINQWLDFDLGTIWPQIYGILVPIFRQGQKLDESKVPTFKEKVKHLDDGLAGKKYLVGDNKTIADLSLLASITMLEPLDNAIDLSEFKNVKKWQENLRHEIPDYKEINDDALDLIRQFFKSQKA